MSDAKDPNLINCGTDEISKCNWCYLSILLKHGLHMDNYLIKTSLDLMELIKEKKLISCIGLDHDRYLTGSMAEGLFLPISKGSSYLLTDADYDELLVMKYFGFHQENESCSSTIDSLLHIEPSKFRGYCHIYNCKKKGRVESYKLREHMVELSKDGYPYPKSVLGITQKELEKDNKCVAITFTQKMKPKLGSTFNLSSDTVFALQCEYWPADADEWKLRYRRYGWPSDKQIKEITNNGCHIVPKTHPLSSKHDEWRYSFSLSAELPLALSFNNLQRFSYLFIKMFLKKCKDTFSDFVLTTYYLKTTMYWYCEETDPTTWVDSNIGQNTMNLLDKLIFFIEQGNVPNYFIPDNNMISHLDKASTEYQESLRLLHICRQYPIHALLESDKYTYYPKNRFLKLFKPMLDHLEEISTHVIHIISTLQNIINFHFVERNEFLFSIPPIQSILFYLTEEVQAFNNLSSYPYSVGLECCLNKVGRFDDAMKQNEINLRMMEKDATTELILIGSWLINRAQYLFAESMRKKICSFGQVGEIFLIAEHFCSLNLNVRNHCLWLAHYANFLYRKNKLKESEKILQKCLTILKTEIHVSNTFNSKTILKEEEIFEIGPCEYITFDLHIQEIFQIKHQESIVARYDYDIYSCDQIQCPMVFIVYYLLVAVHVELRTDAQYLLHEFDQCLQNHIKNIKINQNKLIDSFNLIAHSYLKVGHIEKVEYWFNRCYLGDNVNQKMNAYHQHILTFFKLCAVYDRCFLGE